MRIEVVYALPMRQTLLALEVPDGTTAIAAVRESGILQQCPELRADDLQLGVFGTAVGAQHLLRPGDRVEIYRPLQCDPREARRRRAQSQR